jgi:hypothetical protein
VRFSERRADVTALSVVTLVLFFSFIDVLLLENRFYIRDITRFHFPMKKLVADLVRSGEFPFWTPLLSAGQPVAANPNYQLFYPPTWLTFLGDFESAFSFHIVLHFFIVAFGVYFLIRSFRVDPSLAALGALSFSLGGVFLSSANLFPFMFSMAWLPWTLWRARIAMRGPTAARVAAAAIPFGMQCLIGEPMLLVVTAALLLAAAAATSRGERKGALVASLAAVAGGVAIGLVQLLPAVRLAADSSRSRGLSWAMVEYWSLPPERLLELLLPKLFGVVPFAASTVPMRSMYEAEGAPYLYSIYVPSLLLIAALAGFVDRRRRWLGPALILVAAVVLALGSHTPLLALLYAAGIRFLRYPEKLMLLAGFAVTVWGAIVLQDLLDCDERRRKTMVVVGGIVTIAAALVLAFLGPFFDAVSGGGGAVVPPEVRSDCLTAVCLLGIATALLAAAGRLRRDVWTVALFVLVVADVSRLQSMTAPRVDSSYFDRPVMADGLSGARLFHQPDWHRDSPTARQYSATAELVMWSLRNGLYPRTGASWDVATVLEKDIDQTLLLPTVDFVESMVELRGRRREWFEVIGPLAGVTHRGAFRPFSEQSDRTLEEIAPVVAVPVANHGSYWFAESVERVLDRRDFVQKLAVAKPGARTIYSDTAAPLSGYGAVRHVREEANRIEISVDVRSEAWLYAAVTADRFWRAEIDGAEAEIQRANIGFMAVRVPRGSQTVVFSYRDPLVIAGGVASALSLIIALALIAFRRRETVADERGFGE